MVEYDFKNSEIADIVNNIIIYAVSKKASDIHFDPVEKGLKVRLRIDGSLQDHALVPLDYQRNITTRIKLLSNMNITESRLPQDGAIKGSIQGVDLDMRVSSLVTNLGEKIVIRILDYTKSNEGLNTLGFSEKNLEKIKKMIQVPNGIILITGATGSGKSTTTYTMLKSLNTEDTNIITVEDPVEMNIEGINQVQVNAEIGLTFASALRSILRQDPNIILIGEIRDTETAQIAVRASITGHVVFSTIHTNNSLNTIERLLDMDVERYLLSSALEGIVSQKLAKKLCPKCRRLRPTTVYEKKVFKKMLNQDVDRIYDVNGSCENCRNGYHGRIAIQEVLLINDEIRDAINDETLSRDELRELVYSQGVTTLLQDGLEKVLAGITTFEEIYKLVDIDDDQLNQDLKNLDEVEVSPTVTNEEKQVNEIKEEPKKEEIKIETPNFQDIKIEEPKEEKIEELKIQEPVVNTTPVQNNTPVTPVQNTTPVTPVAPVQNTTPVTPVAPVQNNTPVTPVAPVQNNTPVTPVQNNTPVTPVQNNTPVTPVTPVQNNTPVTPVTPVQNNTPVTPVAPVQNTQTVNPLNNQNQPEIFNNPLNPGVLNEVKPENINLSLSNDLDKTEILDLG